MRLVSSPAAYDYAIPTKDAEPERLGVTEPQTTPEEGLLAEAQADLEARQARVETDLAAKRREAEALIKTGQQKATATIQAAREEAYQIIQEARDEAGEIKRLLHLEGHESGQAEAGRLMQAADDHVAEVRRAAHTEGFQAGRVEGRAVGEANTQDALHQSQQIIAEAEQWRSDLIQASEPTVVQLVIAISDKLFGDGFNLPTEQLNSVITRTLEQAQNLTNLRIHLHPDDATRLQPLWREDTVALVPDESVQPGGCLICGDQGEVDSQVRKQLDHIQNALRATAGTTEFSEKHS